MMILVFHVKIQNDIIIIKIVQLTSRKLNNVLKDPERKKGKKINYNSTDNN